MAATQSGLLRLPPELRSQIWDYVLEDRDISQKQEFVINTRDSSKPALLHVNKQIQGESLGVYCATSHFKFVYLHPEKTLGVDKCCDFLHQLGEKNATRIRHVVVRHTIKTFLDHRAYRLDEFELEVDLTAESIYDVVGIRGGLRRRGEKADITAGKQLAFQSSVALAAEPLHESVQAGTEVGLAHWRAFLEGVHRSMWWGVIC